MGEDILSIDQAAKYLSVSDDTIRRLIKEGELPAARIRGQWRIRKADLDALFRRQQPPPQKETDGETL